MKMKPIIFPALKILALTFILFVIFSIAGSLAGTDGTGAQLPPDQAGQLALFMLLACFLQTIAIAYPIMRSRWTGWRLVLAIFGVFFGIATFLSQIESIVFLNQLVNIITLDLIVRIFIQGFIVAALFAPLAVFILGKMRRPQDGTFVPESGRRLPGTWPEWLWKLSLTAVIYIVIYFTFGFLVAWQSPAVREYYANLQTPAWMFPFQFLRGLIWAGLAVPVIAMMKGRKWEAGLAVALLYSILMGIMLIVPHNPIMPDGVRLAHLKELLSSNFLFGWIVVFILHPGSKENRSANLKTGGVNENAV